SSLSLGFRARRSVPESAAKRAETRRCRAGGKPALARWNIATMHYGRRRKYLRYLPESPPPIAHAVVPRRSSLFLNWRPGSFSGKRGRGLGGRRGWMQGQRV